MMQNISMMLFNLKMNTRRFISDEKGEVNIVAIVVLIGIAVLLAVIFKDKIIELLESLFGTIEKTATDAVSPTGGAEG